MLRYLWITAVIIILDQATKLAALRYLVHHVEVNVLPFLSFTLTIVFAFGLAFQVPVVIVIIVWTGLVSRKALANARPYVFLGAFVVGMVLTPPDVFSQTLLALPMYALYELALFICARFLPER